MSHTVATCGSPYEQLPWLEYTEQPYTKQPRIEAGLQVLFGRAGVQGLA
jgi:hypothetical protein